MDSLPQTIPHVFNRGLVTSAMQWKQQFQRLMLYACVFRPSRSLFALDCLAVYSLTAKSVPTFFPMNTIRNKDLWLLDTRRTSNELDIRTPATWWPAKKLHRNMCRCAAGVRTQACRRTVTWQSFVDDDYFINGLILIKQNASRQMAFLSHDISCLRVISKTDVKRNPLPSLGRYARITLTDRPA